MSEINKHLIMSIANTVLNVESKKKLNSLTAQFDKGILTIRELDLGEAADKFIKETILPAYHGRRDEIEKNGRDLNADITVVKATRAKRKTAEAGDGATEAATAPTPEAPKTTKSKKSTADSMM
jgi:hypothetical protein